MTITTSGSALATRATTASQSVVLTGTRDGMGDVAASIQATRRTFIERGAEMFSPVLYLRGPDSRILDFKKRRLVAPVAAAVDGVRDGDHLLVHVGDGAGDAVEHLKPVNPVFGEVERDPRICQGKFQHVADGAAVIDRKDSQAHAASPV